MPSVDELIDETFRREGADKFTDDPKDDGGPTRWGITQAALSAARGRAATVQDVRDLSETEAREIFHKVYYLDTGAGKMPGDVQPVVFDMFVNHKPRSVARMLQQVVSSAGWPVTVDKKLGPRTIGAIHEAAAAMGPILTDAICDERAVYYHFLVGQNAKNKRFLDGWLKRAAEFRSELPPWLPRRFHSEWLAARGQSAPPAATPSPAAPQAPVAVQSKEHYVHRPPTVTERVWTSVATVITAAAAAISMWASQPRHEPPAIEQPHSIQQLVDRLHTPQEKTK